MALFLRQFNIPECHPSALIPTAMAAHSRMTACVRGGVNICEKSYRNDNLAFEVVQHQLVSTYKKRSISPIIPYHNHSLAEGQTYRPT
ncbi:hypothetical protein GCK32_016152 [Trichostrongylus colubriformis]|uniref:Uncharacterized protein n=1 Tax=Trichostrongylus colubriformis TaxID=6319 RepID=A0AAN8IG59_TRICO